MAWGRVDDCADQMPALLARARNQREADLLLGILMSLLIYCAKHLTNGFLPTLVVRQHLRGKLLATFTSGPDPLLHTPDHECECLGGRAWPENMAYHLHCYLKWNPTKEEHDVKQAKAAELKDRELIAAVRGRDKDRCRYCGVPTVYADRRGGRGLVLDHIDPAVANGAANLVTACRSCNSKKGHRTPAAAGMNLLPEPGEPPTPPSPPLESAAVVPTVVGAGWSTPGPQFPAPGRLDNAHFPGAAASTSRSTTPTTNPATNRPINGSTNEVSEVVSDRSEVGPTTPRTGRDGTGRVDPGSAGPDGERDRVGPAEPRRSSANPNPYLRSGITGPDPADHAGLPRGPPR
jgi:5-methylcytosine-specific restriction endonuclease McrA